MSVLYAFIILFSTLIIVFGLVYYTSRKCINCGSVYIHDGYYIRGWNHLCEQACGSRGVYCRDCGFIEFDVSHEEYSKGLPSWCEAYPDKEPIPRKKPK